MKALNECKDSFSKPKTTDRIEANNVVKNVIEGILDLVFDQNEHVVENISKILKPKLFSCKKCGKKFAQALSAKKHCTVQKMSSVHEDCPTCKKRVMKKNLKRHMEVHSKAKTDVQLRHDKNTKHHCNLCDIDMSSKHKLKEHSLL